VIRLGCIDIHPSLDKGGVESARNVGATPYREILIELKE
jgi:hypothetical protein